MIEDDVPARVCFCSFESIPINFEQWTSKLWGGKGSSVRKEVPLRLEK